VEGKAIPRIRSRLPRARSSLIGFVALSLVAVLPGVAVAGPVSKSEFRAAELFCSAETATHHVDVFASVGESSTDLGIGISDLDNESGPAFLSGDVQLVEPTPGAIDAELEMLRLVDPDEGTYEPAGTARLHVEWQPIGHEQRIRERPPLLTNNAQRVIGTIQDLAAEARVEFEPIGSLPMTTCAGQLTDLRFTINDPTTVRVGLRATVRAECDVVNERGGSLRVSLNPFNGRIWYTSADGQQFNTLDQPPLTTDGMVGELTWIGPTLEIVNTGVDIRLTPTHRHTRYRSVGMFSHRQVTESPMVVNQARLTAPTDEVFDLRPCSFVSATLMIVNHAPSGPPPSYDPPANDHPANAIDLGPGTIRTSNRGAAPGSEGACGTPEVGDPPPYGRTMWFAVEGNGAPVTIDTAGSDFDTVVAVYDGDPTVLGSCTDDVVLGAEHLALTQQAVVVIDTVLGHRYLIEIGGFDGASTGIGVPGGEYGHLMITRR
jgi:hypothetical protein